MKSFAYNNRQSAIKNWERWCAFKQGSQRLENAEIIRFTYKDGVRTEITVLAAHQTMKQDWT